MVMVLDNTAVNYVRVSTKKESQKESPEHQRMLCEEKARMLGLDIVNTYEDRSSGSNIMERDDMKLLIEDAKKGYFKTIIFASLSRFSRDQYDALAMKRLLVEALGIRLISVEENYDSNADTDNMKFTLFSMINEQYSHQVSLSSKRGLRMSAKNGNFTGSKAPFGYQKVIEQKIKTLEIDEKTAPIVELIFDLYVNHKKGEKSIVNYLNQEQIPSPNNGVWGITTIQRILQNEAYCGYNVYSKYESKKVFHNLDNLMDRGKRQVQRDKEKWERNQERNWDPIIDDELFKEAQNIRLLRGGGTRGGVRNKVNVFAGKIFCEHCGSSLVACKSGKKSKNGKNEYYYLVCSARRRQGDAGCRNNLWIPYDDFKKQLLDKITETLQSGAVFQSQHELPLPAVKESNKEKEKKKLEKTLEQNRKLLFELRKEHKLGDIDDDQFQYEKEQYEKEIAEAQEQLSKIKEKAEVQMDLSRMREEIEEALENLSRLRFSSFDELRLVLTKIIEQVIVSKEGHVVIHYTFSHAKVLAETGV